MIRPRVDRDLTPLVELLRRVHEVDGYPAWWPEGPERFIAPPYEEQAWVAEVDGNVVGHVALHQPDQDPAFPLASAATDQPLVAVGRLFTAPDVRGTGLGRELVAVAVDGRRRFLNVVADAPAATLYPHLGWQPLGDTTITLPTGVELALAVFLAP